MTTTEQRDPHTRPAATRGPVVPPHVLPYGPQGRGLGGHLADLDKDVLGFMTACARDYGPL